MDRKRQIAIVAGLVAVSCLFQWVLIQRATVPALDAVCFVELAQRIDAQGLLATWRHEREQPLFPAWVWLVHKGLRNVTGERPWSRASSVQLAAAIPLVLAVIPVYFVSLRLIGPSAALAGTMLFCVLPEVSRLGADGLGDSTHLLLFCLALWALLAYFGVGDRGQGTGDKGQGTGDKGQGTGDKGQGTGDKGQRLGVEKHVLGDEGIGAPFGATCAGNSTAPAPLPCPAPPWARSSCWLLVAGVLMALAVLVRVEGLVLPGAVVIALVLFQFRSQWRQSWPKLAAAVGCLAAGCGIVFLPYLVAVKATSPRAAIARILGQYEPAEQVDPTPMTVLPGADDWRLADDESMSFATKETTITLRRRGYAPAAVQLADELADAFSYAVGALALFGLWRLRRRLVRPEDRLAQLYCLLLLLALFHFTAKEGYLSARHLLTLVVLGIGLAGYGALDLGRSIARWHAAPSRTTGSESGEPIAPCYPAIAWVAVLLAGVLCLSEAVAPLHAGRRGHRLAGEWLAQQAHTPGPVLDTRGWTGLYSGRPTYRYDRAATAFGDPRLAYVVLERRELEYGSRRSRTLEHLLHVGARPVAVFPGPNHEDPRQGRVLVYRWNPQGFARWVSASTPRRWEQPAGGDHQELKPLFAARLPEHAGGTQLEARQ